MKKFQIWIGHYSLGQGSSEPMESQMIGEEDAIDFKTACIKHELKGKMNRIVAGEKKGDLNQQDYEWFYHGNRVMNDWLGRYFETKDEADQTLRRYYWRLVVGENDLAYAQHSVDTHGVYGNKDQYTAIELRELDKIKEKYNPLGGESLKEYEEKIKFRFKQNTDYE